MPIRRIVPLFVLVLALASGAQAQSYRDGLDAFRAGEIQEAFDVWKPLAEAGNPSAQFGLAVIYEKGSDSVPQDLDSAARWYELAAVQGHTAAQNNLGHMYSQGLGVQRDKARAVELWKEAAKGGHETAYYNLGLAYYRGEGTQKDETQAAKWFAQAADAGLQEGQFAIGEMYRLGIGTERNESRALSWYDLAAAQGHQMGQRLAEMLREKGVRPSSVDTQEAVLPAGAGTSAQAPAAADTSVTARALEPVSREAVPTARPQAQPQTAVEAQPAPVVRPAVPAGQPEVAVSPAAPALGDRPAGGSSPTATQTARAVAPLARSAEQTAAIPEPSRTDAQGVHIWLASMKSADDAEIHWRQIEGRHTGLFDDLPHLFTKVDLGSRGTYYRVMVGPIDDREVAQNLCQQMRSSDPAAFCKVLAR